MIASLVFSLIAFFIVSTTTFIVISNRAKVNNINNKLKENKDYILNTASSQDKKVLNLINEVDIQNKQLQHENKKTKVEFENKHKRVDNKINNLDNVFNSYKNITTANFMGINNRMSREFERVDTNVDELKKRVNRNNEERQKKDGEIENIMNQNQLAFDNFKKDQYSTTTTALREQDKILGERMDEINETMTNAVISGSNIDVDTRRIITQNVQANYKNVNTALSTFFGKPEFIRNYTDVNMITNSNANFKEWMDEYYNIENRIHFKTMDDMILLADNNRNDIVIAKKNITDLKTSNVGLYDLVSEASNLYKHNFRSYMQNEYNFDLTQLNTIASNSKTISTLNSQMTSLSNTLEKIGIFDVKTEGSITLANLNETMMSNQALIKDNMEIVYNKFDIEFSSYLESNIPNMADKITTSLNQTELINKLKESEIVDIKSFGVEKINANEIVVNGQNIQSNIDTNSAYSKMFNLMFDFHEMSGIPQTILSHNKETHYVGETGATDQTMIKFINQGPDEDLSRRGTNNGIPLQPRAVMLSEGVNMYLQSDNSDNNGNSKKNNDKIGGRLYLDSFDNIGLVQRNNFGVINQKYDETSLARNYRFKDDISLGSELKRLDSNISDIRDNIKEMETAGITKSTMYKVIASDNGDDFDYKKRNEFGGYGKFSDALETGFRIPDLYTGSGFTNCATNPQLNKCQTVDSRLNTLEMDSRSDKLNSELATALKTFGKNETANEIGTDNAEYKNIVINHTNTKVKDLQANNVNVNGKLHIGADSGSKLVLERENDLVTKDEDSEMYTAILDKYVKKTDNGLKTINLVQNDDAVSLETTSYGNTPKQSIPLPFQPKSDDAIKSLYKDQSMMQPNTNMLNYYTITKYDADPENLVVPKKFSHGSWNPTSKQLTLESIDDTNDPSNSDRVDNILIPTLDRNSIIDNLKTEQFNHPSLGAFISFGSEGCINMSGGKLKVCNTSCGDCVDVWDKKQAKEPTQQN